MVQRQGWRLRCLCTDVLMTANVCAALLPYGCAQRSRLYLLGAHQSRYTRLTSQPVAGIETEHDLKGNRHRNHKFELCCHCIERPAQQTAHSEYVGSDFSACRVCLEPFGVTNETASSTASQDFSAPICCDGASLLSMLRVRRVPSHLVSGRRRNGQHIALMPTWRAMQ